MKPDYIYPTTNDPLTVHDRHVQNAKYYEEDAEGYRNILKKVQDEIVRLRLEIQQLAEKEKFYQNAILFSEATAKWHAEKAELTAEVAE